MNYFKATYLCYVFFLFSFPFLFVVPLRSSGRSSSSISRHTCERMCKIKYGRNTIYYIVYYIFFFLRHKFYKYVWRALWLSLAKCPAGEAVTLPPPPSFTPLNSRPKLLCVHFVLECLPSERGGGAQWGLIKIHFARGVKRVCCFFLSSSASARFLAPIRLALLSELCKFLVLSRICYTLVGYVRLFVCLSVCLPASLSHCPKGIKINHTWREGEKEIEGDTYFWHFHTYQKILPDTCNCSRQHRPHMCRHFHRVPTSIRPNSFGTVSLCIRQCNSTSTSCTHLLLLLSC